MARARNIKPSLFKNEVLGIADPLLTILFESLWCLADKAGRLEDRPLRIKAETFPYREGIDVDSQLAELDKYGFIKRYAAGDQRLIQVVNFEKHQHPHHTEKPSTFPCIQTTCHVTVKPPLDTSGTPSDSLNTDSLIPEEDAAIAATEIPVERRIWKDGIDLLQKSGLKEPQARPLLGRLARDHGKQTLAECIAATQAQNPADPKTYLIGALNGRKKERAITEVGKWNGEVSAVSCPDCYDTGSLRIEDPKAQFGIRWESCPKCQKAA